MINQKAFNLNFKNGVRGTIPKKLLKELNLKKLSTSCFMSAANNNAQLVKAINDIKGKKINISDNPIAILNVLTHKAYKADAFLNKSLPLTKRFNEEWHIEKTQKEKNKEKETEAPYEITCCTSVKKEAEMANDYSCEYFWMMDTINLPGNMKRVNQLTQLVKTHLRDLNNVSVKEIPINNTFGGIMSVHQGTKTPASFLEITVNPNIEKVTGVFVGKGVCYDTGGLSLKPSCYMEGMHKDCSGVIALTAASSMLSKITTSKKYKFYAPIVENLVSEESYRPSDIITLHNGTTVEVINTDAEGRLILADALSYASSLKENHDCKFILDLATLTGAREVAVGKGCHLGVTLNEEIKNSITSIAIKNNDLIDFNRILPNHLSFLSSSVADIKNCNGKGDGAGAITAGMFLLTAVTQSQKNKWVHIDYEPETQGQYNLTLLKTIVDFSLSF